MKEIRLLVMPSLLVMLGGCATVQSVPEADSAAAKLFVGQCQACHALPHPGRNSPAEWRHILAVMDQRMVERFGHGLAAEERDVLLSYLQKNARR